MGLYSIIYSNKSAAINLDYDDNIFSDKIKLSNSNGNVSKFPIKFSKFDLVTQNITNIDENIVIEIKAKNKNTNKM